MNGAEGMLSPTQRVGADSAAAPGRVAPRHRLFRKYALLLIALIGGALSITSGVDFWFSYQENKAALVRVQQEKAQSAAQRIEEFIGEIERQIGWTTHVQWASAPLEQRRQDYFRLLRQVPAITDLRELDAAGREQLKVSRLAMDVIGSEADLSASPAFIGAKAHHIWFSPVYFRKQSEPYLTLAIERGGRNAGVTVADVNLKLIWDVITDLRIGERGYAYVVDGRGRLIAHPDISLVLRDTDLSKLPQVAAALRPMKGAPAVTVARNLSDRSVLTAHAAIAPLGWLVFVEVPLREAFAPLYGATARTALLLAASLAAAVLVALVLARRLTGPIRAISEGAERIGLGELDRRIDIRTGDEIENLAGQFNRMAGDLQRSYAELEQRVADRTAELSEALAQQTATAEVLQVINSSPGDLAPVFDAMLEKATRLCEAAFGILLTYDGRHFRHGALRAVPDAYAEFMRANPPDYGPETGPGRILAGERIVHAIDMMDTHLYRSGDPNRRALVDLAGARSVLLVPLLKDNAVRGIITVFRQEVRPFTDKQIALLENFAAQAVIAMENARLITETRDALDQQTATAEVLQVINASPGDLAPVFDTMLDKALRLCEAAYGHLATFDDGLFHTAALCGEQRLVDWWRQLGPFRPPPGSAAERIVQGEQLVHIVDAANDEGYRAGNPTLRGLRELGGMRSLLAIALRKDKTLLGAIIVFRREVRPFTDKQIALLQNFAAQAVIAMENARLLTETREALEQQTATAEVLQVINSSPGDLTPVFEAILEKAHTLCGAAHGSLQLYDGERLHAVATQGVSAAFADILRRGYVAANSPASRELIAGSSFTHILDSAEVDHPVFRSAAGLAGMRTVLFVPLRRDDAFLGLISAARTEVRPFSDKEIALLQNFATQAVIAMENARLLNELRERTRDLQESLEYQTAISDVLRVISSSAFDLDPVLQSVVTTALRLCRADQAVIYRNLGGEYRWAAGQSLAAEYERIERKVRIRPSAGTLVGRAALEARTVHILDAWNDPLYEAKEDARVGGVRTMLGVPLLRDGMPIGVIGLARQRVEAFTSKQVELVNTFADQAVIAIENARLLGELRTRTDELAHSVEELKALSEVGQAVSSTLDLGSVLSIVLHRSVTLAGADAGAIFRYSRGRRAFRLVEAVGWDEALAQKVDALNISENETGMGEAAAQRAPVQIPDLAARASYSLRDMTVAAGFRSVLIVPLIGPERPLGAIVLMRRVAGAFPDATVRLMQTVASQSVLAIQNARLFREIAEKSEQLAEASRHKSQFLANMSHELRTPLNAILGYTELMADGIYGELPTRAEGVLERVQNNGKHLLALINDVLDLSKIEAGQLVLSLEDYALPDVVRSVVSATEGLASTKGLKFTADIAPGLPMGHGDARRLSQVLLNLVGNAVKFTDAGEVAISAAVQDGDFVLTVRDTGPGIAPADHGRIFEEFQQVDSSNTRKKGGTGLGLAISKRMVEMQGGTISVESELSKGATFRVTLPIRVENAADELIEEPAGRLMGAA